MTIAQTSLPLPVAPREPKDVTVHGDRRNDDYFWLRDRDDPRTLAYLRAENAYADAWFAPHAALKEQLYQEMFGRIQQDDDSVPYRKGLWWYSSRTQKGDQYPRYIRRRAVGSERSYDPQGSDETMLDLNELARGQAFLRLGLATVTLDANRLAYTLDLTGGRDFTLHIRDLATGKDDAWTMPQVSSAEWANDGRTLYYVTMDQSKRASKLWRHVVGAAGADALVLEEKDELFDLGIGKTLDDRFLVLTSESKDSNEQSVMDADAPPDTAALRIVFPRRADIEYDIEHRAGSFFVRINDTGRNFRLVKVDAAEPDLGRAEELIAARDRVMLDDFDVFAEDLVVTERVDGNLQLRVLDLVRGGEHTVAFDEPAYAVHTSGNAEFETRTLRFVYNSMTTPASTFDYQLASRERRAEEAPAGARLRPRALPERARHGPGGRRHRDPDLAGLAARPEARRPAAAAALRLRQLRHPARPRGSRRPGCRCSIAAWSSRSPTSAAAATSAAPGTRPARWRRRRPPSATSSPAPRP